VTQQVARRPDLLWRRSMSQVLVMAPATGALVVLEGTAVELWDVLASPRSIEAVISTLADRHSVEPSAVAGDVGRALAEFEQRGLLERRDG
jgi:hypothetical protein